MPDLFADHVPIGEMLTELRRELELRRVVYPHRVAQRRLRPALAERRIRVMEAIIELVEKAGESG